MGDNLWPKSQIVAGGHKTTTPSSLTYSSVASWYIVRIDLTIFTLNYLKVLVCNIQIAYLNEKLLEKIWTVVGPYFGSGQEKVLLYVRSLCEMKSYVSAFRDILT